MPSHHGKSGKSAGVSQGYQSVHDTGAVSQTPGRTTAPVTSTGNGKKTTTGDGLHVAKKTATVAGFIKEPLVAGLTWGAKKIGNIFQHKATHEKTEHRGLKQNLETGAYEHHAPKYSRLTPPGGNGGNDYRQTFNTQSLVTAPTADKGSGFGHQWGFQAYPGAPGTTYDPTQYAKKGKMIYKYGTGQEVKKRSLPPSKGPDSKGLPSILENSDYFTKLIGE